jgi:lysine/ornithine N-monooxygenase
MSLPAHTVVSTSDIYTTVVQTSYNTITSTTTSDVYTTIYVTNLGKSRKIQVLRCNLNIRQDDCAGHSLRMAEWKQASSAGLSIE